MSESQLNVDRAVAEVLGNILEVVSTGVMGASGRPVGIAYKTFPPVLYTPGEIELHDDTDSDECEIVGELQNSPVKLSQTNGGTLPISHYCTPSTSGSGTQAAKLTKKTIVRKKSKDNESRLEAKIAQVEKWKFECIKQIKILEEQELPDGIEGELILEKIDKLRKKAVQFEESLSKFIVYDDAEYGEFMKDGNKLCVDNKIVLMETDLEPLNALLTEHVSKLQSSEDMRAGYRCVTMEHVEAMLKTIRERGDCPVYDVVVPKDKEQFENFVLRVVELTNMRCRQSIFKQLIDENYCESVLSSKSDRADTLDAKTKSELSSTRIPNRHLFSLEKAPFPLEVKSLLSDKLLIMKSEGLLNEPDEDCRFINLSDSEHEENESDADDESTRNEDDIKCSLTDVISTKREDSPPAQLAADEADSGSSAVADSCEVVATVEEGKMGEIDFEAADMVESTAPDISGIIAPISKLGNGNNREQIVKQPACAENYPDNSPANKIKLSDSIKPTSPVGRPFIPLNSALKSISREQVVKRPACEGSCPDNLPADKKVKLSDSIKPASPVKRPFIPLNSALKSIVKKPMMVYDNDGVICIDDDDDVENGEQVNNPLRQPFSLNFLLDDSDEEGSDADDEEGWDIDSEEGSDVAGGSGERAGSEASLVLKDSMEDVEIIDLDSDEEMVEPPVNNNLSKEFEEDDDVEVVCEIKK